MRLIKLSDDVLSYCKDFYPDCGECALSDLCIKTIPITEYHINKNTKELNERRNKLLISRHILPR